MKTRSWMGHRGGFWCASAVVALGVSGCALEHEQEDASEYRQALPAREAVVVWGPENAGEAAKQSSAAARPKPDEPWADGPWARWYGFTRHVRDSVNHVTGAVLGSVWIVAHTRPTSVSENEAIWGPYSDALEPAAWRLRIGRVGDGQYEYFLEGRPVASRVESDFRVVLSGTGFGRRHENHGKGSFTIDLDVARELDPFAHEGESGTIHIEHDLPRTITRDIGALPRTILADVQSGESEAWFTVRSVAHEDATGTLEVDAFADVDDSKATLPEDVAIVSQWAETGAGRADIVIAGGDVPEDLGAVSAVECWGSDFYRTYYQDSLDFEPSEGDPDACAFSEPLAP